MLAGLSAQPAQAITGTLQNSPTSDHIIWSDNYCYAAKLGSTVYPLKIGAKTSTFNHGFRVTTGHHFSVIKNGKPWITNVLSQGNAICINRAENYAVIEW
jgi:hypothetical protein